MTANTTDVDTTSDPGRDDDEAGSSAQRARRARLRTIATNVGVSLFTLWVISVVTFAALNVRPPIDIARGFLGREASPAALEAYVEEEGLDRPAVVRYGDWLGGFVQGDWGETPGSDRPVRGEVLPRFWLTILLAVFSLAIALPLSLGLGVYMAKRSGTATDLSLLTATVVVASMPEFVIGIGLVALFGVALGWFPVDSTALVFGTFFTKAMAFVLPTFTLVLAMIPHISRIARASAREALSAPYVQAAALRGLSTRRITWDHAMRNAAVPLVNAVAINVVYLLAGVIVVENVFAFPGVGEQLVQAIGSGDSVTVLAIAVVMGAMFIVISLVADMLVVYFNPLLKASG